MMCLSSSNRSSQGVGPSPIDANGPHPRASRDVELVTQVSLDRWPRFAQQALAWGGPVSVAVYLPCPPDHPMAGAYHDYLRALADALRAQLAADADAAAVSSGTAEARRPHLMVSVVYARILAREGAAVLRDVVQPSSGPPLLLTDGGNGASDGCGDGGGGMSYEDLYPINALRNAALRAATCSHVWLVDGDFIPSRGLREALLRPTAVTRGSSTSRCTSGGGTGGDESSLLELSDASPGPVMWVVPAFELRINPASAAVGPASAAAAAVGHGAATDALAEVPDGTAAAVPRTIEQLAAIMGFHGGRPPDAAVGPQPGQELRAGGGAPSAAILRPFHCGLYPQPHPSTDYERWWAVAQGELGGGGGGGSAAGVTAQASAATCSSASATGAVTGGGSTRTVLAASSAEVAVAGDVRWISVPYHEYFEPYGIARRDQVPLYDERFRGYGLNKVQHAYHLAAAGFEFRVLTRHFCVTVPHARSVSYRAVFGTAADPQQRLRVERLYEQFKQEMYDKYGYRYTAPGAPA